MRFLSSNLSNASYPAPTHMILALRCPRLTSGFSPCLKKASSPLLSCFFSLVKYPSSPTFSTVFWSIPFRSTFMDVAMTYRALTLLNGTPLTLKGPVTSKTPCGRCLRRMTRLPRKRPARRIRTVPGTRDGRGRAGLTDLRTWYPMSAHVPNNRCCV